MAWGLNPCPPAWEKGVGCPLDGTVRFLLLKCCKLLAWFIWAVGMLLRLDTPAIWLAPITLETGALKVCAAAASAVPAATPDAASAVPANACVPPAPKALPICPPP